MLFELSRRYARLPRWVRGCVEILAAAAGAAGMLAVFALLAQGPDGFKPFGPGWRWLSLGLFAALSILSAVLGNAVYERFHTWESERLPSAGDFFRNHDLTRLVGQSIGMILRACEEDLPDSDARLVHRLALRAEGDWPEIAASTRARAQLPEIHDSQLVAFVRNPARPALTESQTAELLALLHPDDLEAFPDFADPESGRRVAAALARRFGEALRQALKRDFARRGEAAYGMWLDIAGELLTGGAAELPRTADNAQAVRTAGLTLNLGLPLSGVGSAALKARMQAQAERLDATYNAVRAADHASRWGHQATHGRLVLVGLLVLAVGLPTWYWHHRAQKALDTGQHETAERLAAIESQLRKALAPKQAGEDPTQRQFPPELIEKARELAERGTKEQQAIAAIALKRHAEADALIQDLKRDPLAETFRLLSLEGDNWYNAGEFDRAIRPYEQALALQPEDPGAMNEVAIAHEQARLGDSAAHQRRAIALLTQAQGIRTRDTHPADWATIQNNLGAAWADVPTGDRGENLKHAIAAYDAALTVRTREARPADWASTQNNLGNAWAQMPNGDRGETLKRAIAAYDAALTVRTRAAHPADWAMTQNNLGNAWADMPTGDRGENLKRAIAAYDAALTVYTREAHPADWARTQNNLGVAWRNRPTGDRGEHLKRAISAYDAALTVYTREAHPAEWARTQNDLGTAWADLPTGDRGENLQRTIAAYDAALTVYSREAHPVDWAMTQNNLGNAWAQMPIGDQGGNLKRAIAAYDASLTVYTRDAHPADWAMTQNNLGNAWADTPIGDPGENLKRAIAAYDAALTVYTRAAHPAGWATTRFNLGLVYRHRAKVGGAPDLCRAIAEVHAAATVVTESAFPFDFRNRIVPALDALRSDWESAGHGTAEDFDAIPPAE